MMRLLTGLLFILGLSVSAANAQSGITPCAAATLSVTAASSNTQLSACGQTILLWNVGTTEIFYKYGTASTTAATSSDWSLPGSSFVVLNLGLNRLYLAAITAAGTSTVRVTQGQTR